MTCFIQVTGPSGQMTWIRGGPTRLDAWNINEAIDNRLVQTARLATMWPCQSLTKSQHWVLTILEIV